jgi:hypothetical protein
VSGPRHIGGGALSCCVEALLGPQYIGPCGVGLIAALGLVQLVLLPLTFELLLEALGIGLRWLVGMSFWGRIQGCRWGFCALILAGDVVLGRRRNASMEPR